MDRSNRRCATECAERFDYGFSHSIGHSPGGLHTRFVTSPDRLRPFDPEQLPAQNSKALLARVVRKSHSQAHPHH
jgi:hypothetical protein